MMKLKIIFLSCFVSISLVSCIQEEALNAEADILECIVSKDILKADPLIENDRVSLRVHSDIDLTQQAPEFILTPGAKIVPASGTVRDFTNPQTYQVTSQDGNWKKTYRVSYITSQLSTNYNFENYRIDNNAFYVFYEMDQNNIHNMDWATGNIGFSFTGVAKSPDDYPTIPSKNGKTGGCVQMQTKSTGSFGVMVKKPIAAGTIYIGSLDLTEIQNNPRKAIKLGFPFEHQPLLLKGFYKYEAGPVYTDMGQTVDHITDTWDAYAIFYETDNSTKVLDGTNKFTHPNIVSIAQIDVKGKKPTANWTEFNIPFVVKNGKKVDLQKLKEGKYNLSVLFTSSIDGDDFKGAVGSTLYIDDVEVIYDSN